MRHDYTLETERALTFFFWEVGQGKSFSDALALVKQSFNLAIHDCVVIALKRNFGSK